MNEDAEKKQREKIMLFEKVRLYLENQKRHMMRLDGATEDTQFLTERETRGLDFVANEQIAQENNLSIERPIGLLEILYNNTINWLMAQATMGLRHEFDLLERHISEDTTTSDIATFTTQLLPAVRRFYAGLISKELVSVQPLGGPSGYIYWIDHMFSADHAADGISAGDRLDQHQDSDTYTDSSEKDASIPEIELGVTSKLIQTEIKKVMARWTLEAAQDVNSQWKLNLESELIPRMGELLAREIDRKVINALLNGAGAGNVNWSVNPGADDKTSADKNAYYQTLWHAIALANSYIASKKFRNADWLVMNYNTYYYFQRLENYNADPHADDQQAGVQRRYVGKLNNLYKVYIDPFFTDNKILMGIRGDWLNSVGYFSPYIPLYISDKYIYANDFSQFLKGAQSRYAYGVIPDSSTQSPVQNSGLATVTLVQS
jgi:hypothetical protein